MEQRLNERSVYSTLESSDHTFDTFADVSKLSRRLLSTPTSSTQHETSVSPSPDPGGTPATAGPDSANGNAFETLDPNVVIILVVLLFALICAAFLNSIMRCVLRRSRNRVDPPDPVGESALGLDSHILESLPIFVFKASEKSKDTAADCTICLSEFVENERLRLLPKCSHVFHLDCIDMWLLSHVSCPVCRDGIGDDVSITIHDDAAANSSTGLPRPAATPNLRAELLRDRSRRLSSDAISQAPGQESAPVPARRSARSTLYSMFAAETFAHLFSARRHSTDSSPPPTAPTTSIG